MQKYICTFLSVALCLTFLFNAANAIDRGWNRYSCAEFSLTFEYPAFLNTIDVECWPEHCKKQLESDDDSTASDLSTYHLLKLEFSACRRVWRL